MEKQQNNIVLLDKRVLTIMKDSAGIFQRG